MIKWFYGEQIFLVTKAVPGDYIVKLSTNGVEISKDFTILKDPTSEGSIDDIKAQFDFVNEVNAVVDKAHKAIINIRKIKMILKSFSQNILTMNLQMI